MMILARIGDFIADRRFPWHRATLPKLSQSKTESGRLVVALTFDVEQDGGSSGKGSVSKIKPFLSQVAKSLRDRPATFFIQGNLVKKLEEDLKALSRKHELGVHGWEHNRLWGDAVWFLKERPLTQKEKALHLAQALEAFQLVNLPRPKSFRATNLIVNQETLRLLVELGFMVDSSWESFRDFCRPFRVNGLWEIPVGSLPRPRQRLGIFKDYQVLNVVNLQRLPTRIWQENVRQIISAQRVPHIVFMGHSWDFRKKEVEQLLTFLEKEWQVEYLTLQELTKKL